MCKWMEEIDGMVECDIANKPCLTMEWSNVRAEANVHNMYNND